MSKPWSPLIESLEPAKDPNAIADVNILLTRMVSAYGQVTAAGLLGVDRSAVNQWLRGKRAISAEMRRRVIEVHDVLTRVHQVWPPALAGRWLTGHEPLLGGARPIDVIGIRGAGPVIAALDAISAGGYA